MDTATVCILGIIKKVLCDSVTIYEAKEEILEIILIENFIADGS